MSGLEPGKQYSYRAFVTSHEGEDPCWTAVRTFVTQVVSASADGGFSVNLNLRGADSHQQQPGGPAGGLPLITAVPAAAPNQTAVLRFEFVRRIGSGLIYTPQKTTGPGTAAWVPLTALPSVTPVDAARERVVYEEPVGPAALPLCFGRVQGTVP